MIVRTNAAVAEVAAAARPLEGGPRDFDALLDLIGDAPYVLIGEASHGTHEFYRLRAELTKRLVVEKGFNAVAAEADWPDAYRVNRWVRGVGGDVDAEQALAGFQRFPSWMWRNADVLDFVGWLRDFNEHVAPATRVGFYGLDLYSLQASIQAVLSYLGRADPEAAARARERYACFEGYGEDPQWYGRAATLGLSRHCEDEVVAQLVDLNRQRESLLRRDGMLAEDDYFHAEQNARVVRNAEQYYRTMFGGRASSWNLRDRHMADTLDALVQHLGRRRRRPRVVVWAHNSHVGDARATAMGRGGELTIGQLARERHPREAVLVGFSTYEGTVTAARDWDEPAERMTVRPGLEGSWERLFHDVAQPAFLLLTRDVRSGALEQALLQRAIGVVYRPETERQSHYYAARLVDQFDALIHVDRTRALEPMERAPLWHDGEPAETFPSGV